MNKLKFLRKTASAILAAGIIITMPLSAILETTVYAASTTNTSSNVEWPAAPEVTSESAILIDADTGAVLYEKDSHRKCYPASTTKILTGLLAIENCSMTDTITFSSTAANSVKVGEDANIGTKAGEEYTVEQALYALLLYSANEVAYGLAEQVSGSLSAFTDLMNAKAKELGAIDSHFSNASGLYDPNHYTTAYDMAMIARGCYNNSTFVNIDSTSTSYTIPPTNKTSTKRTFSHRHKMLKGRAYYYEYCKGGKTGYTDQARTTLVTMADNGDMQLVAVVLYDFGNDAYIDTRAMFDYAYSNFSKVSLKDQKLPEGVKSYEDEDAYIVLPKSAQFSDVKAEVKEDSSKDGSGTVTFTYKGQEVGSVKAAIEKNEESSASVFGKKKDKTTSTVVTGISKFMKIVIGVVIAVVILLVILIVIANYRKQMRRRKRKKGKRRNGKSGNVKRKKKRRR